MTQKIYDVIVVGAGIFGSCTAFHCQKSGLKTLLLEQFKVGHSNGSSHGMTRIIRYAHAEKECLPLVDDTYSQIAELEKQRNEKLWKNTGLLWAATGNQLENISKILKDFKINHEIIDGEKIENRYPQFKFNSEWKALIDPMGGVIYANKWLNAFQTEFKNQGGKLQDLEEVKSYDDSADLVAIITNKGAYKTKKVVFTVGPWLAKLLPNINFKIEPLSIAACFWQPKDKANAHLFSDDKLPAFIARDEINQRSSYGLPGEDYPGTFKCCYHTGAPLDAELNHPEKTPEQYISWPGEFLKEHVPLADSSKPKHIDLCKYTMSPDHGYVLGPVSDNHPNLIVGGCGSGSGFKVAPAIGRVLSELAAGKEPSIDISQFSPKRFN
ncbi:unnamed protein product [Caenorhabditis bovis]|uniref:sarcosine oxidasee (formaldehyde-forming) n=1 Tax=Caenorhabditis bovis TaxID=2654633 RepID=A0A8S1EBP4_9PELO|nr:unnamed protein product [Caenorhabditis bovis]